MERRSEARPARCSGPEPGALAASAITAMPRNRKAIWRPPCPLMVYACTGLVATCHCGQEHPLRRTRQGIGKTGLISRTSRGGGPAIAGSGTRACASELEADVGRTSSRNYPLLARQFAPGTARPAHRRAPPDPASRRRPDHRRPARAVPDQECFGRRNADPRLLRHRARNCRSRSSSSTASRSAASRKWIKDGCVGVTFDQPVDVIALLSAHRWKARVRACRGSRSAALAWLREDGTIHRAQDRQHLARRDEGRMRRRHSGRRRSHRQPARAAPCAGKVRWADSGAYGVTFNRVIALPDLVAWLQGERQRLRAAG